MYSAVLDFWTCRSGGTNPTWNGAGTTMPFVPLVHGTAGVKYAASISGVILKKSGDAIRKIEVPAETSSELPVLIVTGGNGKAEFVAETAATASGKTAFVQLSAAGFGERAVMTVASMGLGAFTTSTRNAAGPVRGR